jgi:predicted metal-dependent hydrolase
VAASYLSYYRPGFHPWQEDDRALIAQMQAEYAA